MRWGVVTVSAALLLTACGDEGDSPDDGLRRLKDFERLCYEDGVGYSEAAAFDAAAFSGREPHPMVGIESGRDVDGDPDGDWYLDLPFEMELEDLPPDRVQLVACHQQVDRVSDEPIGYCTYDNVNNDDGEADHRIDNYQARHRVDIYEARTRRSVGRITVDGPASVPSSACSPSVVLPEDDTDGENGERDFGPEPEVLLDAVAVFVTGAADS
jgi:hypothetical protein